MNDKLKWQKIYFASINDNTKIQYQISGFYLTLNIVNQNNKIFYYLDSNNGDISNANVFHNRLEKLFGKII